MTESEAYRVLGLPENAGPEHIRTRYRELPKTDDHYHMDIPLDICVQIDEFDNEDSDNLLGSEWHKYLSDSYESFIENIKTHKKYKPCR